MAAPLPPEQLQLAVPTSGSHGAGPSGTAQPAGPVVLKVADLERLPRLGGSGGKTACQWQRDLRRECITTAVSDKDVTDDPLYNWKGVLRAASEGLAESIIGPGIVRVSFRIIESDRDHNYSNIDGHGKHVFEFLGADV